MNLKSIIDESNINWWALINDWRTNVKLLIDECKINDWWMSNILLTSINSMIYKGKKTIIQYPYSRWSVSLSRYYEMNDNIRLERDKLGT